MNSTEIENMLGEALFAWWQVLSTPLLFLGQHHPFSPGHPLNPLPTL
jgi:hypothetical protein